MLWKDGGNNTSKTKWNGNGKKKREEERESEEVYRLVQLCDKQIEIMFKPFCFEHTHEPIVMLQFIV